MILVTVMPDHEMRRRVFGGRNEKRDVDRLRWREDEMNKFLGKTETETVRKPATTTKEIRLKT